VIGPATAPPPMATLPPAPASLPPPPAQGAGGGAPNSAYSAATVSSGPQPSSVFPNQPAPVMLPPLHYQGIDAAQPFGYQPPQGAIPGALGMHPTRMAALGTMMSQQTGMIRSAEEMDGADNIPPAKRQRVARLPGGQLYPEADWIAMHPVSFFALEVPCFSLTTVNYQHPISLQVQMPNDSSKPEWKLDGSVVAIPDLPLNLLVSTLRDRILQHTESAVPASRIRVSFAGKMLTNSNSIASYNLEDEDLLVISIRDPKKK
jgi:splicing factor 3A subunit 1